MRPAVAGLTLFFAALLLAVGAARQTARGERAAAEIDAAAQSSLAALRLELAVDRLATASDLAGILAAVPPAERRRLGRDLLGRLGPADVLLAASPTGEVSVLLGDEGAAAGAAGDGTAPSGPTLVGPLSPSGGDPVVAVWRPAAGGARAGAAARWSRLLDAAGLHALPGAGYDWRLTRADAGGTTVLARFSERAWRPAVERGVRVPGGSWRLEMSPLRPAPGRATLVGLIGAILSAVLGTAAYALARRPAAIELERAEDLRFAAGERDELLRRVDELEREEHRLRQEFFHDPQTGLPTRAYFMTRLANELESLRRDPRRALSLIVVELSDFRTVAAALTAREAATLLAEIGRRIDGCLGPEDLAARLSPDEFAVLAGGPRGQDAGAAVAGRLRRAFAEPIGAPGAPLYAATRLGIAHSDHGLEPPSQLLENADLALRRTRGAGPGATAEYAAAMREEALSQRLLESDLQAALERGELVPHFQPIVDLRDGALVGFEALVRWERAGEETVPPARFLPLAEDTGLIVDVDRTMLRRACEQVRAWLDEDAPGGFYVSVNLSGRHLLAADLADSVRATLDDTGLAPERLRLEITESALIGNFTAALEVTRRLRRMGVRLLLDDFGTGYSSLSALHRFEIDVMKIDASFVREITAEGIHRDIARTIVSLSQILGLATVAEGIESEEQRRALLAMGCKHGQGFLFGEPMPARQARARLALGTG